MQILSELRSIYRFFKVILIGVALLVAVGAQQVYAQKAFKPGTVWTKIVIPTAAYECRIEIGTRFLSPIVEKCIYEDHLKSGSQLSILSRKKEGKWVALRLRTDTDAIMKVNYVNSIKVKRGTEFDFYIESKSFDRVFARVFSLRKVEFEYPGCYVKTVEQTISKVGFPSSIYRDNGKEKWTFSSDHVVWNFCNYDVTYLYFENGKLKELSGLI